METVMLMEWKGVTPEQYDRILTNLGMDAKPPVGGILHIAGFTNGTLRVLDIWESQKTFEEFRKDRLTLAAQRAGVIGQPKVEFYPVHNLYAPNLNRIREAGATSHPLAAAKVA